ncbi:MAG TPA: hypothetical protein VKV04_14205 [Verrucomicrobiae bacterium]|nr:hypothetical protein [Verrucomicrobiae bacterium]
MKLKSFAALPLCAFALSALADAPTSTVTTRNSLLMNNWLIVSNAVPLTTNANTFTNITLTAPYQHDISVTTLITATNAVAGGTNTTGSGAFAYTNFFDLGKILVTNGVYTTNWTTDTPIQVTGTGNGLIAIDQARQLVPTNFDSYDLLRLTKYSSNATNSYTVTVILGQTP